VLYYYTEGTAPSGPTVFSAVVTSSQNPTTTMGTIPGANGKRIRITQIGICGDSDSGSGPNRFTVSGGGFDFSFAAGQSSVSTTYFLGVTPTASGSGRGFITKSVSLLGSLGQGATVQWDYHNDWDGRFCQATDPYGNAYNDGASSVRSWIAYTYE
jgi:hypothetical protein